MKKLILPLAAGFALGLSGAAMAGNVGPQHGKVAAQGHSIVATVTGPQLLTDSQMDNVVAGDVTLNNGMARNSNGATTTITNNPVFSGNADLTGPPASCTGTNITFTNPATGTSYNFTC